MNAESTPVRNELKFNIMDDFDGLTPIRRNHIRKRRTKHFWKRVKREISKYADSEDESDSEPVIRSQVVNADRKCSESEKDEAEKITVFTLHEDHKNSNELIGDQENLNADCESQYCDSALKFLDSGVDQVLADVNYDLEIIERRNTSNNCPAMVYGNEISDQGTNYGLAVSDVMRWNDKSLMGSDSYLSDIIKQKLLDNASNNEIIVTQGTGWTQFDAPSTPVEGIGPFHGLPLRVQQLYQESKGILQLFCMYLCLHLPEPKFKPAWQEDCLSQEAVKKKRNLVYSLPTSGGKSLVAEILMLREILIYKKNVLFVLPFVSIVQEKIRDLSQFALEFNFSLEEYAAGKGVIPPKKYRKKNSLMIATIEKALVIVNSLIEANRLEELGMVVVDELHLLSEEGRGSTLEILLIQILHSGVNIQVIGMTATMGNLSEVAAFLKAETYIGHFRPVQLQEYVKCGDKIYSVDLLAENLLTEVRTLRTTREADIDGISKLVEEVAPRDSVLVFCATKKNCENVATLLSQVLPRNLMKYLEKEKASLYRALASEMNEKICPVLKQTLPFGVAYHHSGLTVGERKLLEEAFRQGTLSVVCCTSTLAVGVNLPAKRVILRSPYVGKDFVTMSKYKQMVGRAGRTGLGSNGESFLICQPVDVQKVRKLFTTEMDETTSKMDCESCQNLILTSVGLGTATTINGLKNLMKYSLLHNQGLKLKRDVEKMVEDSVDSLIKQGALKLKTKDSIKPKVNATGDCEQEVSKRLKGDVQLTISRLGRAAMKGGLSLETAHELYNELVRAQANLVILTNFHLLYLVTPFDFVSQVKPNYSVFFHAYMQLDEKDVSAARVIGITESVISKLAVGRTPKNVKESLLGRFYISMILHELWNQKSIWEAAQTFQLPRGLVQTLLTSAATFVNNVLRFCEELEEFWCFKCLLKDFAPRLAHCCAPELLPLMELPAVKRGRAKQLYDAGFKTIQKVACASPMNLVRCLDHMPFNVASQIIAAAKLLLVEKADSLREEAEGILEELGTSEKAVLPNYQSVT